MYAVKLTAVANAAIWGRQIWEIEISENML